MDLDMQIEVDTTALRAELSDLKDRFMEQADRAASSRDSIVRLRDRLRSLREVIEQLRAERTAEKQAYEYMVRDHAAYIRGLKHGHENTLGITLQRLVERSEYVGGLGAEMSALEGRLDRLESVAAVGVPKGTGEDR